MENVEYYIRFSYFYWLFFDSCIFGELQVGRHAWDLTILMGVIRKNIIFCYMTPCSLVAIHRLCPKISVNSTRTQCAAVSIQVTETSFARNIYVCKLMYSNSNKKIDTT